MKKLLSSIWFLALVIAIPVIVLLPPVFEKYKVELRLVQQKVRGGGGVYYTDLQGDGKAERVEAFNADNNLFSFQCFEIEENTLYDQFNFPHFFCERLNNLFFFDFDNDRLMEVYGFSCFEDSVFLSYIEPYEDNHPHHQFFITTIDRTQRVILDVSVKELLKIDLDNDHNDELVFSLAVGYNRFPRKIFVVHPETGVVERSEEFGVHFSQFLAFDHEKDGDLELLCVGSSANNIDAELKVKYHDDRSRVFLFDKNLKELLPPVEFPVGIGSRLTYYLLDETSGEMILYYQNYSSLNNVSFITKMYPDGKAAAEDTIFIEGKDGRSNFFVKENADNYVLITGLGKVYRVDRDLKLLDFYDLEYVADGMFIGKYDLLEDGRPEFVIFDDKRNIRIYLENFSKEIQIDARDTKNAIRVVKSPRKNEFVVDDGRNLEFWIISKNILYYLKYPGYVLIYFLSVGFIWLLQAARMRQLKEKFELQNRVRELQLLSLKNQLDPHFIFNTFNTIASVIKQGRNDEAYNIMVQFSKLVRLNLDGSGNIYTTLKGELDFIRDYLSIQKFRFREMFDHIIEIGENVNTEIAIPKLLIQIHVENALKHGIRPLRRKGLLQIRVAQNNSALKIEIEDDGIGREKSKKLSTEGTGMGLKTIEQIIELNNQNRKHKISQEIVDLKDQSGNAAGTLVVLKIKN